MIKPDYTNFKKLFSQLSKVKKPESGHSTLPNVIPVYKEILADTETPVSAYLKIQGEDDYSFLLESIEGREKIARYSFLGFSPFRVFRSRKNQITIEDRENKEVKTYRGDPISELRKLVNKYRSIQSAELPRFTGGAVGYLSYDAVRLVEDVPDTCTDDLDMDEMVFLLFDTILAFDNLSHKIILISNVHVKSGETNPEGKYSKACRKIEYLNKLLLRAIDPFPLKGTNKGRVVSNISNAEFQKIVQRSKEYILAGDVIQVVLSQRLEREISVKSFDIYRMLRIVNPSPYMYHISLGDAAIVGSSPELFVRVEDDTVDTRPIAGTRRRGYTEEEDRALEKELLSDGKEKAEHIMLVDLGRNDLGKISKYGSVELTEKMAIEKYSHVMHIVSNVRGKLKDSADQFDALFACFPAGTVSGAPKIRALEIIDELEPTKRSVYAGAIGYLDFSGNLDSCITIRTILVKNQKAYIQAGAGIVADSDPEREYWETMNKAKSALKAVEMAEGSFFFTHRSG